MVPAFFMCRIREKRPQIEIFYYGQPLAFTYFKI
jgi:hypothetical protein